MILFLLALAPQDTSNERISAIVNAHKARLLLVLHAYEQDCYNDSTKTNEHRKFLMEEMVQLIIHVHTYDCYSERWTHREPTFTGFIRWLDKK